MLNTGIFDMCVSDGQNVVKLSYQLKLNVPWILLSLESPSRFGDRRRKEVVHVPSSPSAIIQRE